MKLYSIKPLEWEEILPISCECNMGAVEYYISFRRESSIWDLGIADNGIGRYGQSRLYTCNSLDEAKAKAQEDWNNRISQYLTEYKGEK